MKRERAYELLSTSLEETQMFGECLGRLLRPGDVVALQGELGSGKTTLIQGLARGLGRDPGLVKSPTFVLLREYPGEVPLIHLDAYRLEGAPAATWLDVDLIFSPQKITVIEWAQRVAPLLPPDRVDIHLAHVSANRRRIMISASTARGRGLIDELEESTKD